MLIQAFEVYCSDCFHSLFFVLTFNKYSTKWAKPSEIFVKLAQEMNTAEYSQKVNSEFIILKIHTGKLILRFKI